jgi:hypothetical protein
MYALGRIYEYARKNQYILIPQYVWGLDSVMELESALVKHIDTLHIQEEVYQAHSETCSIPEIIHPDRVFQLGKFTSHLEEPISLELSQ